MGRIAILDRLEYEYEYRPLRRTEYDKRQNSDFLAVGCGLNDCSCLGSDFVVLVLSEAVLSETVLVLDGCLNCGDL